MSRRRHRQRRPQRRGVLLLIVLSLLVLFVLIGITFIVVAGQYTKAAHAFTRHELKGDPPSRELESALKQLLRGTADANTLMFRHNLLRDLYGVDGFEGSVLSSSYGGASGHQFVALQFADIVGNARPSDHYYAGSVLTLLDGQGRGQSTRIVRYQAPVLLNNVRTGVVIVESFEELPPGFLPAPSTRFVVNGKPFNGTGDGYNPMSGKLDDTSVFPYNQAPTPFPSALLPLAQLASAYGDSDETWDAADYQNLFLARIPSTIPLSGVPVMSADPLIPSFHRPFLVNYWMNRIAGMQMHWAEPTFEALRRYTVARPMPEAHPFFTGSNPAFTFDPAADRDGDSIPDLLDPEPLDIDNDGTPDLMIHPLVQGPWDVDNDNDGVADSIWVDLGFPVKSTPDGRMYKPLFAILCVDLDGRLNVNAHGVREVLTMDGESFENMESDIYAADEPEDVTLGQGYGPAEIRLDRFFRTVYGPVNGLERFSVLLRERYRPRYGVPENPPSPGLPDDPLQYPFPTNTSLLSSLHLWGLPSDYRSPAPGEGNLYLSPPDLAGVGGVYLDKLGQPRFVLNQRTSNFGPLPPVLGTTPPYPQMGTTYELQFPPGFGRYQMTNAAMDNPYELDLVTLRGEDSVLGVDDLEEVLRFSDLDAQMMRDANQNLPLPMERASLARILGPLPYDAMSVVSRQLTTHSFDIPALNATIPSEDERQELAKLTDDTYRASGAVPSSPTISASSLVELLRKRLLIGLSQSPNYPNMSDAEKRDFLDRQIRLMLPPEVRAGGRMNVNRLFANAIDDNGNGVVDEPGEWSPGQPVLAGTPMAAPGQYGAGDPNYDATNPYFSRQQFARHLYCLAMLAMDEQVQQDGTVLRFEIPDVDGPMAREATARRMAQWAVNVVDFRDPDVIMTPFEYDSNPFDEDGWSVDELPGPDSPDGAIVWGCESPELLITESLAFHDRRVRDTNQEVPELGEDDADAQQYRFPPNPDAQDHDATLDQFRIPQGSLFIELYATGNALRNNHVQSRELYNLDGTLDLGRLAVNADGVASPVWRIAVVIPDPGYEDTAKREEAALLVPALLDQPDPDNALFRQAVNDHGLLATNSQTTVPHLSQSIDRCIIFTERSPGSLRMPAGQYFYNHRPRAIPLGYDFRPPHLAPGEYAVIGPRPVTALGSVVRSLATPPIADNQPSQPAPQRVVLRPQGFFYYDLAEPPAQPTGLTQVLSKPALTILAAADAPLGLPGMAPAWTETTVTAPLGIGVNISEPMPNSREYYTEPITGFPSTRPDLDPAPAGTGTQGSPDRYIEPASYYANLSSGEKTLPDEPFDGLKFRSQDSPLANAAPMSQTQPTMTGTHTRFRVLLLQRLADPTQVYDDTTNPYITVDSQPVDLTVFNGEDDSSEPPQGWEDNGPGAAGEPFDILDDPDSDANPPEHFESRERGELTQTGATTVNGPNVWNPTSRVPEETVPEDPTTSRAYWGHLARQSLGALNSTYFDPGGAGTRLAAPPEYLGAPLQPFPWLTWNNRPFVSQLELMLVPSSAPWRLPFEMRRVGTTLDNLNEDFLAPWGHLLNFFYDDPDGLDPNLSALLDWLEVPSRFVATQKWLSPGVNYGQQSPELYSYAPPFNRVSRFRDPGKINLNTIPDALVWQAVYPVTSANDWPLLQQSLAGDQPLGQRPAFYGNPLRAAASADLMPLEDLETSAAEATLLRKSPGDPKFLLFDGGGYGENVANPDRNAYFMYHKIQRLGNLVTAHSNVYAVWITVGYFEVYPWNATSPVLMAASRTDPTSVTPFPDAAHPDGYQLGPELGSDAGNVKRHRAFYIIDRSIPAGYKPGEDLNVERTVILRRFVE